LKSPSSIKISITKRTWKRERVGTWISFKTALTRMKKRRNKRRITFKENMVGPQRTLSSTHSLLSKRRTITCTGQLNSHISIKKIQRARKSRCTAGMAPKTNLCSRSFIHRHLWMSPRSLMNSSKGAVDMKSMILYLSRDRLIEILRDVLMLTESKRRRNVQRGRLKISWLQMTQSMITILNRKMCISQGNYPRQTSTSLR
jgi:hypothetical protein